MSCKTWKAPSGGKQHRKHRGKSTRQSSHGKSVRQKPAKRHRKHAKHPQHHKGCKPGQSVRGHATAAEHNAAYATEVNARATPAHGHVA